MTSSHSSLLGGICMQRNKENEGEFKEEVMFTQEEVNDMMRKRLARVKRKFDKEFEHKILQIEVIGRLQKATIPPSFAQFIMVSKNQKRTRQILEQFIKTWHEFVK